MARLGGVLAIVVSALWAILAALGLLLGIALLAGSDNDEVAGFDEFFDFAGTFLIGLAAVVLIIAIWGITIGVNVIQGDTWARVAGFITFGLFCLASVATLFGDNNTNTGEGNDNIAATVANAAVCGVIALLMLTGRAGESDSAGGVGRRLGPPIVGLPYRRPHDFVHHHEPARHLVPGDQRAAVRL